MGSRGFELARDLRFQLGEAIWEVGSERGEGSTRYLGLLAAHRGVPFYSSDVDLFAMRAAGKIEGCTPIFRSGEETIRDWHFWGNSSLVRFAWLDGADWPYTDLYPHLYAEQLAAYRARGQEYSQEASARSHREIAEGLHPWVALGGVVAFDDTWLTDGPIATNGVFNGKGRTAVPWLLARGYEIVQATGPTTETHDGFVALRRVR